MPPNHRFIGRLMRQMCNKYDAFVSLLDGWVEDWFANRPLGLEALRSFTEGVHEQATQYMQSNLVTAKTAAHRLEIAVAALREVQQWPINETVFNASTH